MNKPTRGRVPLTLFTCFHINLAFSSIEGQDRADVLRQCYWPLLRMARDLGVRIGVEANASSLQMIQKIDPDLIAYLKMCIAENVVDFIGSGFAQVIGPLVPADVNRANLQIGDTVYEDLLGVKPHTALVNEQAYSPGLVPLYREAGYERIIMDWAAAYTHNADWSEDWQYHPQKALGINGSSIDILWNQTISFQTFQKYVYGEMSLDEHLAYLDKHVGKERRAFCLYGSDAEIFDFRPKRYSSEEPHDRKEWDRIRILFETLQKDPNYTFSTPSDVFDQFQGGKHDLSLETPNNPIPVKKQNKYNITRWAVSGRDDLWSNTVCWRAYEKLDKSLGYTDKQWRNVCLKWRSDYRTHITLKRWNVFCHDMNDQFGGAPVDLEDLKKLDIKPYFERDPEVLQLGPFSLKREANHLQITSKSNELVLNMRRGLAVRSFRVPDISDQMIFGTLPLGYFTDINWVADFYSGHLVAEVAGKPKVSDLGIMDSLFDIEQVEDTLTLSARIKTGFGVILKRMVVYADRPQLDITYELGWSAIPTSNLRVGHVTLNPCLFDRSTLYYETHNGGDLPERHSLAKGDVNFGRGVSFLTSAQSCLGMTEGTLEIADQDIAVQLSTDKTVSAMVGMVQCQSIEDSYLCRMSLSGREFDETSRDDGPSIDIEGRNRFTCTIKVFDQQNR